MPAVVLSVLSVFLIQISGTVVDQAGRPVPRAQVRLVDEAGAERQRIFADELGRFSIDSETTECNLEASLTGFQPATAPCLQGEAVRLVLTVAPVAEQVLVSATRTEAPLSQVGASATVFTAADLARAQKPLVSELLTMTPGAMVVRSGGPGTVSSLFVRGGESDYNKVLLDGIPLNEPGGTFYLNNLTSESLDRVEVLRGAYSSLFGSDAMSSVIQLFTRRGESRRPAVTTQLDGGTYHTLHGSANVSGATDTVDYSIGGARLASDNRVPNSRLENNTVSGNVGARLGGTATLRVIGRLEDERVGTPGQTAFGRPDRDAYFDRRDSVFGVSVNQQLDRVRQTASFSRAGSEQQSVNRVADPPYRATFMGRTATRSTSDFTGESVTTLTRYHASYQADIRLYSGGRAGDQRLTLLGDWDGEHADATSSFGETATNARNNVGVSVQEQMLWPRFFVTLGGRLEHNDSFGAAAVPRASVVYVAHTASSGAFGETHLRVSAGAGIKEPTMVESFSPSPFFLGNPDLKPERSRSAELGIEQRFARERAKITLAYFYNRYRDVITLITNQETFEATYENVGLTRARGLELGFQTRPVDALHVNATYTYLDTDVLASERPNDVLFGLGRPLLRRPKHSGTFVAGVDAGRATADLIGTFVGEFTDSDFGLFIPALTINPGHTTWDARLTVRATRRVTGILTIDNLTNADYSEPFGYQPLRRVVRAGVRVGF